MTRTRLSLLATLAVLVVALFVGARGAGGPATPEARADHLATKVRCPTCSGVSAAQSDASASVAIRDEIARRVAAGETDGEILRFFVDRYGDDILLTPSASGAGAVVWGLPVVALVLAAVGLVVAFRRWRSRSGGEVSEEDRALVARAMRS